jgi:hypothetical protein
MLNPRTTMMARRREAISRASHSSTMTYRTSTTAVQPRTSIIRLMASSIGYFSFRSAPGLIINVYLQATGGFYEFAVNRIDGAIIGMDLSSPRAAVLENWDRPANDVELPQLAYCADIYWHY